MICVIILMIRHTSVPYTSIRRTRRAMYTTGGVDSIATITELRSQTADLLEHVQTTHQAVMIQKNNQPVAVLISWELYKRLKDEEADIF